MNSSSSSSSILSFFHVIESLKHTPRTGWTLQPGLKDFPVESIASHMHRMSIMAMAVPNNNNNNNNPTSHLLLPSFDSNKLVKMCLVHDVIECIAGDITPHQGISRQEKHVLEANAMDQLVTLLEKASNTSTNSQGGNSTISSTTTSTPSPGIYSYIPFAQELKSLWYEYESGITIESKIAKDLDKFDMICQAVEYEKRHHGGEEVVVRLDSFFESTRGKFTHPVVMEWVKELEKEREELFSITTTTSTCIN